MTNKYKEALDALTPFINASTVPFSNCAKVCFCHSSALKEALTLATDAKQLREENSLLKQANELLLKDGRKIPMILGRSVEINTEGTFCTDTIYVGEPEFKTELEQLRKERDELARALLTQDDDIPNCEDIESRQSAYLKTLELAKKVIENGNA